MYKYALAIYGDDINLILPVYQKMQRPDTIKSFWKTDGVEYRIFYWDKIDPRSLAPLMRKVKDLRHAMIALPYNFQDGILSDIVERDFRGYDSTFRNIFGWRSDIVFCDDKKLVFEKEDELLYP